MKPATTSRRHFGKTKMLVVEGNQIAHQTVGDLGTWLRAGDLLLVNAASTLPASFRGTVRGQSIEIRLAAFKGSSPQDLRHWSAISFGPGDWMDKTENRGAPPELKPSDTIEIADDLSLEVESADGRLLSIVFQSPNLVNALYRYGKPIQYSYHTEALQMWDQQTLFTGPPISVEPPSAAFPLTWRQLLQLQALGVTLAPILHSAGISSTGDTALDARLPLDEFYDVPAETLQAMAQTRSAGGRVIALGTSVTRAVESALSTGLLRGLTNLKLGEKSIIRGIDILITGMHEEGTSHAELMKAFCGCDQLKAAEAEANRLEYRSHEFGDWTVLNCGGR